MVALSILASFGINVALATVDQEPELDILGMPPQNMKTMFRVLDPDPGLNMRLKREVSTPNWPWRKYRPAVRKKYPGLSEIETLPPLEENQEPASVDKSCFDRHMRERPCDDPSEAPALVLGSVWMFGRELKEGERGDVVAVQLVDKRAEYVIAVKAAKKSHERMVPFAFAVDTSNLPMVDGYAQWSLAKTEKSIFKGLQEVKAYEVVKSAHRDCGLLCDVCDLKTEVTPPVKVAEVFARGSTVLVVGGSGVPRCQLYCRRV